MTHDRSDLLTPVEVNVPDCANITRQMRTPSINARSAKPIDPAVKSWIDNVIVPALVEEWRASGGSQAAA